MKHNFPNKNMRKFVLIILVVLILGVIACNLFSRSPQGTSQPASNPEAVTEAVNSFYQSYDSCMKNPPAVAEGNVSEYCQNNTGLTTSAFAGNLEEGGTAKAGADPIFCAQDIPASMTVNADAHITGDKAIASLNEKFVVSQVDIKVNLVNENGAWKIDNIICSPP